MGLWEPATVGGSVFGDRELRGSPAPLVGVWELIFGDPPPFSVSAAGNRGGGAYNDMGFTFTLVVGPLTFAAPPGENRGRGLLRGGLQRTGMY